MKRNMDRLARLERQLDLSEPEHIVIILCDEDRERHVAEYRREYGCGPSIGQSDIKIDLRGRGGQ